MQGGSFDPLSPHGHQHTVEAALAEDSGGNRRSI
jgi:hypothetical protein